MLHNASNHEVTMYAVNINARKIHFYTYELKIFKISKVQVGPLIQNRTSRFKPAQNLGFETPPSRALKF